MNRMLNDRENTLMEMLTAGELPEMAVLREQWRRAWCYDRDYHVVGFFVQFTVGPDCPRLGNLNFELTDVWADVPGSDGSWSYPLFVRDGCISMLEGVWIGDDKKVPGFNEGAPAYVQHGWRGEMSATPTGERDLAYVKRTLASGPPQASGVVGDEGIRIDENARPMTPDLAAIIEGIKREFAEVVWRQITLSHAADDNGVWNFKLLDDSWMRHVSIESPNGSCPFLVETTKHNERHVAETVADTVDTVVRWLRQ